MACNPVEHFHFHSGVLPRGEGANGCNMIPSGSVLERPAPALLRITRPTGPPPPLGEYALQSGCCNHRDLVKCFQIFGNSKMPARPSNRFPAPGGILFLV